MMNHVKNRSLCLFAAAAANIAIFSSSATVVAQEQITPATEVKQSGTTVQLPVFAETTVTTVVSVPDGPVFLSGVRIPPAPSRTSRELLDHFRNAPPESFRYYLCSKSVTAGTATYDVIHNFKPLKIVAHESGKIEIQLVRHYTDSDMEALAQDHPEIAMHVNALPKELSEYARVKLSLDVESDITVDNVTELENEHPSLHKIYQRWVKASDK